MPGSAALSTSRAAARQMVLLARRCDVTRAVTGSPARSGRSAVPSAIRRSCAGMKSSLSRPASAIRASAWSSGTGSATAGPLAIDSSRSPGTSDSRNCVTTAGAAIRASRPPFSFENSRRTTFMSWISRPLARSASFSACLSASVMPSAGAGNSADPPPLTRSSR